MKRIFLFFSFFVASYNYAFSQSSIITNTYQINSSCTTCCNGSISIGNITYTCQPGGPPLTFALITPTTGTPMYSGSPLWTNLCNGIYTVAVNFIGGDPQNCGAHLHVL